MPAAQTHPAPSTGAHRADRGESIQRYGALGIMTLLSFAAMYVLMYAMVDRLGNVYASANQFYMAGLMAASMPAIELAFMWGMYPRRGMNAGIVIGGLVAIALFWALIRTQAGVGDEQFIKSMVPHHSGAILMCREASIRDAELQALCRQIVDGQQREIDQMKAILARLER